MNHKNTRAILKALAIIAVLLVLAGALTRLHERNSMSLEQYAAEHPEYAKNSESGEAADEASPEAAKTGETATPSDSPEQKDDSFDSPETENLQEREAASSASVLTGASLNGTLMEEERCTYAQDFYYEPLSDNLRRYITGVSYPAASPSEFVPEGADAEESPEVPANTDISSGKEVSAVTYDDLRYVHILHYDFDGNPAEGELICNKAIAQDLVEIFYELYRSEYQLEKVRLIDEYDGVDTASMEDNNTSCFNYRLVEDSTSLSRHAEGLAIDINPLYNPYITYGKDGSEHVSPEAAADYADRSRAFPYKIDENDLCYKLFTEHGFTWGGHWNSCKDYQHFQKLP